MTTSDKKKIKLWANSNNMRLFCAYIVSLVIGWLTFVGFIFIPVGAVLSLFVFYFSSFFMKCHGNWKKNLISISILPVGLLILLVIAIVVPGSREYVLLAAFPFFLGLIVHGGGQVMLFALVSVALVCFVPVFLNIQFNNSPKVRGITATIVVVFIIVFFSL